VLCHCPNIQDEAVAVFPDSTRGESVREGEIIEYYKQCICISKRVGLGEMDSQSLFMQKLGRQP